MVGRFDRGCRRKARGLLAVVTVGVLTACSSVPDAINPVEWYKGAADLVSGGDQPEVAGSAPTPAEKTADQRKDLAKGLVADRGNAQYAQPVRREVAPTRPLARRAPAPQVAAAAAPAAKSEAKSEAKAPAAPVVPPKPAVQAGELPPPPAPVQVAQAAEPPRVSPDRRTPTARGDLAPAAPPAAVDMQPPPRADVPETVPVPGKKGPKRLQQQFEKRLAESAQQVVRPDIVDMPSQPRLAAAEEAPIHLVPPSAGKRGRSGGGKGMAAPQPAADPAASFQVASVDFASGAKLSAADRAAIADVARLDKQTGGIVRVVGHAPAPVFGADAAGQLVGGLKASMDRADAVARELSRRGVPAAKIMVGADPSAAAMGSAGARVYLDVM